MNPPPGIWYAAARLYFASPRGGVTARKLADCCIAQMAVEHGARLVHDDRDLEKIATVRPLKEKLLDLRRGTARP